MAELRIARAADEQIGIIDAWWSEHRPSSPALFARELAAVLEALMRTPTIGVAYAAGAPRAVRRILLGRRRYHVYFSHDARADVVEVRAVWHATRGTDPPLL